MNNIIHTLTDNRRKRLANSNSVEFRSPHYDCREQDDALTLLVYVPGVNASDVEITTRGPDLMVTARKSHFVRVNFNAMHLESAQRDYRLTLRLGNGLDYENLNAEISEGVLTIRLPKRVSFHDFGRLRRVA